MSEDLTGWTKPPDEASPTAGPPGEQLPPVRVARALKYALLGFLVCPVALHLWSLGLLFSINYSALGPTPRRKYWAALCIDVVALLGIAALIYLALTGLLPAFSL